jgi:CheY-like chemotaxis protein
LERSGYKVTTASSGQEALEVFLANPDHFNLVMTDQAMANMTGEELSIELLRLRPDIPIVICTGHSEIISPESSREIGIRAFLQKPATPTELRRVVREVLDETEPGH